MKKISWVFSFVIFFVFTTNSVFAETYFEQILNAIKQNTILKPITKIFTPTSKNFVPNTNEEKIFFGTQDGITIEDFKSETNLASSSVLKNITNENKNEVVSANTNSTSLNPSPESNKTVNYLSEILKKLGTERSNTQTTSPNTNNANQGNTLNLDNPFLDSSTLNPNSVIGQLSGGNNSLSGLLNSLMGGGGQNPMQMFGNGANGILGFANSLCKENGGKNCDQGLSQAQNALKSLSGPYTGPGGSIPGDCGIPKGPWAYNIGGGGNNVRCDAKVVVSGYLGQLRKDVFGAGYINPLTEKGQTGGASSAGNCKDSSTANQYGEGCFKSYALGSDGAAYIQRQVLHWQKEGQAKGQKCVPVDIDNCDSVGSAAYKQILDQIETLNNQGSVKIKVLNKNPHLGGCNFFSHPAVIGAFIESANANEAQAIAKMRNKPEQVLVFARGGGSSNQKLKSLESLNIPNSAYSYDQGSEYQNINECTYKP